VTDDPARIGVGGTSLGGSAALYVVLNRPDLFRLALLQSPNLMLGNGQILRDTMDLPSAPDRVAIGFGSAELHFPDIAKFVAPQGMTEQEVIRGL